MVKFALTGNGNMFDLVPFFFFADDEPLNPIGHFLDEGLFKSGNHIGEFLVISYKDGVNNNIKYYPDDSWMVEALENDTEGAIVDIMTNGFDSWGNKDNVYDYNAMMYGHSASGYKHTIRSLNLDFGGFGGFDDGSGCVIDSMCQSDNCELAVQQPEALPDHLQGMVTIYGKECKGDTVEGFDGGVLSGLRGSVNLP